MRYATLLPGQQRDATDVIDVGDPDAILVDTLTTHSQADALADWIDTKGRRPSRLYITHSLATTGSAWLD